MEFHIGLKGRKLDLDALERALHGIDPAALIDIDPTGHTLRVAALVDADQLLLLINQAGCPVERDQVTRIPSICCGGCSG